MRRSLIVSLSLLLSATAASAQSGTEKTKVIPPVKKEAMDKAKMGEMDHSKMGEMDHSKMDGMKMDGMEAAMSPWKELNAYHTLMMATWHPAKDKNDLAPIRAKANAMVEAAKTLAASTAPKGCDAPKLKDAAAGLPAATQGVADLVAKQADDAALKDALKALHGKFDVLEMGCSNPAPAKKAG